MYEVEAQSHNLRIQSSQAFLVKKLEQQSNCPESCKSILYCEVITGNTPKVLSME